jgi:hypothetical protein
MFRFTVHKEVHIIMNYNLNEQTEKEAKKLPVLASLKKQVHTW